MQNQAENDSAYSDLACNGKNMPFIATTPYRGFQAGCKPCTGMGALGNLLQYPRHEEFCRRISIQQFEVIQKDLQQELYNRSGYLVCLGGFCFGSTGADKSRSITLESLHNVLTYYNRVLFHPMLIDAQVFAPHQGRRDYFVGFLVASSSEEYTSFKRPVVGKSRGYLNPSVTRRMNIRLETGYSVPETVPSAAPSPPPMHSREARTYTPPPGAHMVRVPENNEAPAGPAACPPELSGRPVPVPVAATSSGTPYQQQPPPGSGHPDDAPHAPGPVGSAPSPPQAPAQPVNATVVYPAVQAPAAQVMTHHQEASPTNNVDVPLATAQPV